MKFWTSGRYSKACDKYVWCPEKEIIGPDAKWKKGYPKLEAGQCVAIQLGHSNPDENGFFNQKCADASYFFCHV